MLLIFLAALLLLRAHAQFVPNANCPHPIYATQADVAPWVGITVDTTQKVEIANGLNLFKCTPDTLFFYIVNGVFTRQNWWLACGSNLNTGWRVRDAGSKNTAYGNIPVGCAKPTCTGLEMFDGNEYILRSYSNYEVIPHQPIVITNGKFQIYCTGGSVLGYASSDTTITIQTGMSVFCEAQGWWLKTSASSAGSLLSGKVGCFKQVTEPVLPEACQTGITYFTGDEQILKDNPEYLMTADRAVVVSGKWKLNCPSDCGIGYAESGVKFTYAPTATITCDSYGWWLVTSDNPSGTVLSPDVKVGCFKKQTTTTTTTTTPKPSGTTLAPTTAEREANPKIACGCWFEFSNCATCNWQKMFVLEGFGYSTGKCTLGCADGYIFEGGEVNMLSCQGGNNWFGSSISSGQAIAMPKKGDGWLETSCVPAPTAPTCAMAYKTFDCEGCDASKLIYLNPTKSSGGCTLSCDQEYRLLVLDADLKVTRGQEACGRKAGFFDVYPLGDVHTTTAFDAATVRFSCEPASITASTTAEVKLIGISTTSTTTTTTTTTTAPATGVTAPPSTIPAHQSCAPCKHEFSTCPTCDWQQLHVLKGKYSCNLACDEGYELEGGFNYATCTTGGMVGYWYGVSSTVVVNLNPTIGTSRMIAISCVPAPVQQPKCSIKYKTFECAWCDATKIIPLNPAKSTDGCVLACAKGYRILIFVNGKDILRAHHIVFLGAKVRVYDLDYSLGREYDASGTKFSCEPTTIDINSEVLIPAPGDQITTSAPTSTTPAATSGTTPPPHTYNSRFTCPSGCVYDFSSCPTCDYQQLFVMDLQPYPSSTCTLGCAAGYEIEGGYSTARCGGWDWHWEGINATSVENWSFRLAKRPSISCVPAPTKYTCAVNYATFHCSWCDSSKIIPINPARSKSGCVLACDKEHRLLVSYGDKIDRVEEAIADGADFRVFFAGKQTSPKRLTGNLKFSCEPAFANRTAAVTIIDAPVFDECGCPYKPASCATCEIGQVFVLDGFGATSGKCTIGCAKGYYLDVGQGSRPHPNLVSCNKGTWLGSPSRWISPPLPSDSIAVKDGALSVACMRLSTHTTDVFTCPFNYATFECEGCDSSKLMPLRENNQDNSITKARTGGCVLMCDKGYRLLVFQPTRKVTRAQEVVIDSKYSYIVYPLGDVEKIMEITILPGYDAVTLGVKLSCEPVTVDTTKPVKPTGLIPVPECGCVYSADDSASSYDPTKLFVQDNGPGRCLLQCETGYRLAQSFSSVWCANNQWNYVSAKQFNRALPAPGAFSCEPAPSTTCSAPYGISTCPADSECDPSALRALSLQRGPCNLFCGRGYRLLHGTTRLMEAGISGPQWIVRTMGGGTTYLSKDNTPSFNCEKWYDETRLPPAGALTTCGCAYKASDCPTCEWDKMFVLDGFGSTSGKCTLGCANGYTFEGGQMNMLSCKSGTWTGSSKTSSAIIPITSSNPYIRTSCVPADSGNCASSKYTTFECEGCDKTKIIHIKSTKVNGLDSCVLACDKGFRLVALDFYRAIMRAQEATLQQSFWAVYPLGEMAITARMATASTKFSCEPAAAVTTPSASKPTCGCSWSFWSCSTCDNSKFISRHDGAGTCGLTCAPGFQLVHSQGDVDGGVLTAATCTAFRWFGRTASLSDTFTAIMVPSFTCKRTQTTTCSSSYSPLAACSTCNLSKLRPLSTWHKCQLSCDAGFRLVANTVNSMTGAQRYIEITAGSDDKWSGTLLTGNAAFSLQSSAVFVGCEQDVSTKPLAQCGCFYANTGPDASQLVPRTIWPDGKNCELMCEPGYYMKSAYDMSLVVCQSGKWVGRNYAGTSTITMSDSPSIGCQKMTTDYFTPCANPDWLPLQCAGCSVEYLLPVPSGWTCQFTCRAGWRLVVQIPRTTVISRPRSVYLTGGQWGGTGGQGLLTTLYYGKQPSISCEPDTYPPITDPAAPPKPAAKPCEYCKLPTEAACPAGKSCTPGHLPLWTTSEGCMQVRCRNQRKMLIPKSSLTVDGINCKADGTWVTMSGTSLNSADVAVNCDGNTGGNATLIEVVYNIYRSGMSLAALDPNYVSTIGG